MPDDARGPSRGARALRRPPVLLAFAACTAIGAMAGVLADLA